MGCAHVSHTTHTRKIHFRRISKCTINEKRLAILIEILASSAYSFSMEMPSVSFVFSHLIKSNGFCAFRPNAFTYHCDESACGQFKRRIKSHSWFMQKASNIASVAFSTQRIQKKLQQNFHFIFRSSSFYFPFYLSKSFHLSPSQQRRLRMVCCDNWK